MSTTRGSEILWSRWKKRFGQANLQSLLELLERNDLPLDRINCKGQPDPDAITGTVRVTPAGLDHLTNVLLKMKDAKLEHLEVFPLGIIDVDSIVASFTLSPRV